MRKMTLGLLALSLASSPAYAQMGGMGGGGMGGMGGGRASTQPIDPGGDAPQGNTGPKGPRDMKPISLEKFDKAVARMFAAADTNRDGIVTLAEFTAVIDARRDVIIRNRFKAVDANHNGQIDFDEFNAWQKRMGSTALSESLATDNSEIVADSITPDLGDGERDEALMIAIEPLNAVTITTANTNYDAGVSLAELLAYEHIRFNKADTDKDGFLSRQEIDALRGRGGRRGPMGGPMGGPGGPDGMRGPPPR